MNRNLKERINKHVKYWVNEDKLDDIEINFNSYDGIEYVKEHFTMSPDFTREEIQNEDNINYFIEKFKKQYNR